MTLIVNNAEGVLASPIASGALILTLNSGEGAAFGTPTVANPLIVTLDDENNIEIVKCTLRATDILTVVRAQENTSAEAFAVGTKVQARYTARLIELFSPLGVLTDENGDPISDENADLQMQERTQVL